MSKEADVQVFMRMRPFGDKEVADREKGYSFEVSDGEIAENEEITGGKLKFEYDHVFGPEARNPDVYDRTARHVVESCMNGYNGVIFAYGQTSSGKTHSIIGYDGDEGLIPLAMRQVFDHIKSSRKEWLLRVSYTEVYNEQLHDLLNPSTPPTKLMIYEDELGHTQVKNLQEEIVRSETEVMELIKKGIHNRHVSATAMNAQSSRSHAVFTMIVESRELMSDSFRFANNNKKSMKEKGSAVKISCLYLVDLAGSERGDKTLAVGKTLREGAFINKSLLNLSICIAQLAKAGGKKIQSNFRDSKLTRLIRVGLGGNSKLSVLCCITPGFSHYQESVSTMRFGQSARMIKNKSTVNQVKDETALLKQYKREIEELKRKLMSNGSEPNDNLVQELERHKEERLQLESALNEITQLILVGDEAPDEEFFVEDCSEDVITHGMLLDFDEMSAASDFDDETTELEVPLTPSNSLSPSADSPVFRRSKSISNADIPSLSLTPSPSGKSSALLAKVHAGKVTANLTEQINLLKQTIADLKVEKSTFEKQKQEWENERKVYEEQGLKREKPHLASQNREATASLDSSRHHSRSKICNDARDNLKLLEKKLAQDQYVRNCNPTPFSLPSVVQQLLTLVQYWP